MNNKFTFNDVKPEPLIIATSQIESLTRQINRLNEQSAAAAAAGYLSNAAEFDNKRAILERLREQLRGR